MLQCLKYFKYNYLLSNRLSYVTIRTPSKIKEIFQIGKSWLKYFEAHKTDIRDVG